MNLYQSEWYRELVKRTVEDLDKDTIKKTLELKEKQIIQNFLNDWYDIEKYCQEKGEKK